MISDLKLVQSEASARVVNTLLTELDGLDDRKGVFVIGATNRPDMVDPAMCRPGRLDKLLYVDLPSADERVEIIRTVTRNIPLGGSANRAAVEVIVREKCDGFSGADLSSLAREAGVIALRRTIGAFDQMELEGAQEMNDFEVNITPSDFAAALDKLGPSVSAVQRRKYLALQNKFAGLPVKSVKENDLDGSSGTVR